MGTYRVDGINYTLNKDLQMVIKKEVDTMRSSIITEMCTRIKDEMIKIAHKYALRLDVDLDHYQNNTHYTITVVTPDEED